MRKGDLDEQISIFITSSLLPPGLWQPSPNLGPLAASRRAYFVFFLQLRQESLETGINKEELDNSIVTIVDIV